MHQLTRVAALFSNLLSPFRSLTRVGTLRKEPLIFFTQFVKGDQVRMCVDLHLLVASCARESVDDSFLAEGRWQTTSVKPLYKVEDFRGEVTARCPRNAFGMARNGKQTRSQSSNNRGRRFCKKNPNAAEAS